MKNELDCKSLSFTLKSLRKKKGYSQTDMTIITGLSQQLISKVENKPHTVSMSTFIKYCNGLNIDIDRLLKSKLLK